MINELRQQMQDLLNKQTTDEIKRIMTRMSKRNDDAADVVFMAAFNVLGERLGWQEAERYTDEIAL